MKQTLITALALGLGFLSLLMAPSAHEQRYPAQHHAAGAGRGVPGLLLSALADGASGPEWMALHDAHPPNNLRP